MQVSGHSVALARVRLILSASEMVAAVLFLIPFTLNLGAYALLVVFALAILVHALHGDFGGLEILVLYGVAVWVCQVYRRESSSTE